MANELLGITKLRILRGKQTSISVCVSVVECQRNMTDIWIMRQQTNICAEWMQYEEAKRRKIGNIKYSLKKIRSIVAFKQQKLADQWLVELCKWVD